MCLGRTNIFYLWGDWDVWQARILIATAAITATSIVIYTIHRYIFDDFLPWLLYWFDWASVSQVHKNACAEHQGSRANQLANQSRDSYIGLFNYQSA